MNERERQIRYRLKTDFPHYADKCLKIRTKAGSVSALALNTAQRYLHERLEQQLADVGYIRAIILKGRQQGCSTYTEGRFYWKVSHRFGVRAFILTHKDDATNNLFEMAKRYHEHCPRAVKPSTRASNARELIFDKLDSGYKVGTAGGDGTGRSDTLQYFHGSEVAFWPKAEAQLSSALQAVPSGLDATGTEVILESTSDGPSGLFYDMWQDASHGIGEYISIFIPWYWQEEYRNPYPADFTPTSDEQELVRRYGLDLAQLAWRRAKIVELRGEAAFRREYPCDPEEAFKADASGALWKRDTINALRVAEHPPLSRIVVAVDPAVTANKDSDETGIIVAGRGVDGHGYVLADLSQRADPHTWALAVVNAYKQYTADAIVVEVNNGGDLVKSNIRTVSKTCNVAEVRASRGKVTRAEPIAALYGEGTVHHVGTFAGLEDQMCTWVPSDEKSPDRIDALVWALSSLMLTDEKTFFIGRA
jgi:phage terminase large subunit-like protein